MSKSKFFKINVSLNKKKNLVVSPVITADKTPISTPPRDTKIKEPEARRKSVVNKWSVPITAMSLKAW